MNIEQRILAIYQNRQIVQAQITQLTLTHKNLHLLQGQPLLTLQGTISIQFANKFYNIPLAIVIPFDYPHAAPSILIPPTPNLSIRHTKHVDSNGRVYHPIIAYWKSQNTLLQCVAALQNEFSLEPPVFANTPPPITQPRAQPPAIPSKQVTPQSIKQTLISQIKAKADTYIQDQVSIMPTIMESLKSTKNILLQGSYTIDSMIKNLDHQETEIKKHVEFLINSKNDLTEKTKAIAAEPDLLPDTVINGAGPVDEQFFVVDAEDRALDDVLYHLDRALQSGLVDLNTFIKTVRGLARQQFKARYLKKMIVAELEKNSLKSLTY